MKQTISQHTALLISGMGLWATLMPAQAIATELSLPQPDPSEPSDTPDLTPATIAQQPNPNEERFLQDITVPPPPEAIDEIEPSPAESEPIPEPTEGAPSDPTDAVSFPIQTIEVVGSTVFDQSDFAPITQPLENRSVTLTELQNAADAISQLYLDAGYLTSRAILVEQAVTDGVVQIQVIEGRLSDIQIEGLQRLNERYIRDRIQLGAETPLRAESLEEQLRLLRANPLLDNIEASLRAGGAVGESILVVRVTEADPWFGSVSIDNYSPPSIGSERMSLDLGYRNPTGRGDELFVGYDRTTRGGADIFEFGYRLPVNAMDGTIQFRSVIDRNEILDDEFVDFGIEGESEFYELSFRQPLIRSIREELALSIGFSLKDGQTFLFNDQPTPFGIGPDDDGVSRISAVRFGQDYVLRDVQGAWAFRSLFSFGVDWLDATTNDHPIPDSRFFSWLLQAQRVQLIGEDHFLIAQLDLQLTPDSLLPAEQFVIGGGQSLRGYRQNARSGDNGFRFSLEDRITLSRDESGASVFQLAPFLDLGAVWNHPDNPNQLPNQTFLASAGLGALWQVIPNLNLRLDYAIPFVELDDRGNNAQDDGFYFSLSYEF